MNNYFRLLIGCIILFSSSIGNSQVVLQQNFNTSSPISKWYLSTDKNTSGVYSFTEDKQMIISPHFNHADSVFFWMKENDINTNSQLTIKESKDSVTWTKIATLDALNVIASTGNTWGYSISPSSHYLKFIFSQAGGELAIDNISVVEATPQYYIYPGDTAIANGKIKAYFNHPVDTSVSTGIKALNIGAHMMDTIIAYINRAQQSIDIAEYNYQGGTKIQQLAQAVNNAYSRGVAIRWIYNGSSGNAGLQYLNPNIPTLARTDGTGLMHNKFLVIDRKNSQKATVISGSINWGWDHFNEDYNNLIILQDKALANAYYKEFNEMWGSSTLTPNSSESHFGSNKTPVITNPVFTIGGVDVELYFSPNSVNNQAVQYALNTAQNGLYFGVFTFTREDIAEVIKHKIEVGLSVAGIIGDPSVGYNAYETLDSIMGQRLKVKIDPVYHNKVGIIDPMHPESDPQVITGSYNWTTAAEMDNDENSLIIHSPILANLYYQSFHHDFNSFGGNLSVIKETNPLFDIKIFPVPFKTFCNITFHLNRAQTISISAYSLSGREIMTSKKEFFEKGEHQITFSPKKAGTYFIRIKSKQKESIYKVIKTQ